ncbi:Vesicle-associated membrane protein 4, partial [Blyttiomyces sp. JEL0837]
MSHTPVSVNPAAASTNFQSYNPVDAKIAATQKQVDAAINIYQDNVNAMIGRGEDLEKLKDQTQQLDESAQQFKVSARDVKRKMWWKDFKMTLILSAVIIVIVLIILFT